MLDQHYVYYPARWEPGDWKAVSRLPLEDIWLTTSDGERIFGWYAAAADEQAVLLWCHGNAGNIIDRLDNLAQLHRRGVSVFLFDYRGYGQSSGRPSEDGLYRDALAAYEYVTQQRGVPASRLVIFGRSLGAAVAGELARQRPSAGLILETPFPSVLEVAKLVAPHLPVHLLISARFDLASRLKHVHIPLLVLHGDSDTTIPFSLGQAVYDAANEPKRFYRIPGANHNDTYLVGGDAYFDEFVGFIRRVTRSESGP